VEQLGRIAHDDRRPNGKRNGHLNILPAVCDVSVTNVCNAACDFCGFSRDKKLVGIRRYIDLGDFTRALPILRRRRIRYMTLQGGEPLVHPDIDALVAAATKAGIKCGLITNGWFLARHVDALAKAGLWRLSISIDSADMAQHEENRGLAGLGGRIEEGIKRARAAGIPVWASVTVSRLVDYGALPGTLADLGFDAVTFSYPRRERFGSTSLVYDESSTLVDLNADELVGALNGIAQVKKRFRVLDPSASLEEVARFARGENQRVPCVGGRKYFYIDWNLDIWRCEAWNEPLGSVFELDSIPDQTEPCNECMMACYRHASAMMHGAIAVTDSLQYAARGDVRAAASSLRQPGVMYSLLALARDELPRVALSFPNRRKKADTNSASHGYRIPSVSLTSLALALCGFAVVLWLLHENDYRAVLRMTASVGAGLAIVVAIRVVIVAIRGFAWWCLIRDLAAARLRWAIGFRMIGESINVLLPVAAVGGDIVRAMLLKSRGVDGGVAAASTLVDLLLQAAAQALFALIGITLLLHVSGGAELASWAERGVGVAVLALGGFFAVQRFGGARLVERALDTLARRWPAAAAGSTIRLAESLDAVYADWRALAASFSLHELAWLIGAFETWIALWLMGMPESIPTALVLESLNQGLRAAAFPVPGALGVQEGAYVALGALFGIPAETALALSFVKRVPDLAIGLPGLLALYCLQLRRTAAIPAGALAGGPFDLRAAAIERSLTSTKMQR
jgi:putative membrane protein